MKRIVAKHESEVPSMKCIGVIGGYGQWATQDIVSRMLRASVNAGTPQYGNRGYPPMNIRLANKAPMKLNPDGSYPDKLEPDPTFIENVEYVSQNADFLILTSNTAHLFESEIAAATDVPLLSIVNITLDEVKHRGYTRVGLLAIGITLKKELFQKPLSKIGVESVTLPDNLAKKLDDDGVYLVQEGGNPKDGTAVAQEAVDYMRDQNVDGIILGCTEIPLLLGKDADVKDIVNPSQLLAEAAVKRALE